LFSYLRSFGFCIIYDVVVGLPAKFEIPVPKFIPVNGL